MPAPTTGGAGPTRLCPGLPAPSTEASRETTDRHPERFRALFGSAPRRASVRKNGEHGRSKPNALQIPFHKLDAALHQVMARRTHSVIPVGIDVELEGLVVLDESGNHLVRILNMHVVVARTVRDQQLALQAVGEMNRRVVVVSRRVILRQAVVDFGINRIVEPP